MKVKIKQENSKKEIQFPCLMLANNGNIVLMINKIKAEYTGIVVAKTEQDQGYDVGEYRTDWIPDAFHLWNGEVTLSN